MKLKGPRFNNGSRIKMVSIIESDTTQGLETARQAYQAGLEAQRSANLPVAAMYLQQAADTFASNRDQLAEIEVRLVLGDTYRELGELEASHSTFKMCLDVAQILKEPLFHTKALNGMASVQFGFGQYTQALETLSEVLTCEQATHNTRGIALCLSNMGILNTRLGDLAGALDQLSQAYEKLRHINEPRLEINCLNNIGTVYEERKDYSTALKYYKKARMIGQTSGERVSECTAIVNEGLMLHQLGQYSETLACFDEGLRLARDGGLQIHQVSLLNGRGKTKSKLNDISAAIADHQQSLELAKIIDYIEGQCDAFKYLGEIKLTQGFTRQAIKHLEKGLALTRQSKRDTFELHELLSRAYEQDNNLAKSLEHHRLFHAVHQAVFNEANERRTATLSARFELERARNEAEVYRLRTEVSEQENTVLEQKVRERTQELEEARVEVVMRLAIAAEYRDDHTGQHTWRVGHTSALIAQELGFTDEEVELIRLAARLHDVGKIGISDLIMLKPDRLTPDEYERVKIHTIIGGEILAGGRTPLLQMAESIALSHHEHWNGRGYPLGTAGTTIPLVGRIVAVADVFDALLSERPYKRPWTFSEAYDEIQAKAGTQFDPTVVQAFSRLLERGICFEQP
jgi:HD-GYP domain-containing protein (c-di-GMP phosphodiesterase class II)